jgi:hypothetical protein
MPLVKGHSMAADEVLVVIHGGSGALGLALLAERSDQGGIAAMLLCRSGSTSRPVSDRLAADRSYLLDHGFGRRGGAQIDEVVYYDEEPGNEYLHTRLTTTPHVLYMTAARGGQREAAKIIQRAMEARRKSGISGCFVVAPCENAIAPDLERLAVRHAGPGFAYLDMMVDRISLDVALTQWGTRVTVLAEVLYEWAGALRMAGDQNSGQLSSILDHLRNMDMDVVADIQPIKKRKTFLMNGVQTCLALLARSDKYWYLRSYNDDTSGGVLEGLSVEYGKALNVWSKENGVPYDTVEVEAHRLWYHRRIRESLYLAPDGIRLSTIIGKYATLQRQGQMLDIASKIAEAYDLLCSEYGEEAANDTFIYRAFQAALDFEAKAITGDITGERL